MVKESGEYWVPVHLDTNNIGLQYDCKRFFRVSNRGKLRIVTKKRNVDLSDNSARVGRRFLKLFRTDSKIMIQIETPNNRKGFIGEYLPVFLKSLTGLDARKHQLTFVDDNLNHITSTNVLVDERSIRNSSLYRYKNSKSLTKHEELFFQIYTSLLVKKNLGLFRLELFFNKEFNKIFKFIRGRYIRKLRNFQEGIEAQKLVFSNQESHSFYLLDYYFRGLDFAVEVDGLHHRYNAEQLNYDIDRDFHLSAACGIDVMRIPNVALVCKERVAVVLSVLEILALKVSIKSYEDILYEIVRDKKLYNRVNGSKSVLECQEYIEVLKGQSAAKLSDINDRNQKLILEWKVQRPSRNGVHSSEWKWQASSYGR